MILVDANLLLYATVSDFASTLPRAPGSARLNAPARVGLPWPSLVAFLRIATNPRIFPRPNGHAGRMAPGGRLARAAERLGAGAERAPS